MSDTESNQASIDASDASIPAENGSSDLASSLARRDRVCVEKIQAQRVRYASLCVCGET